LKPKKEREVFNYVALSESKDRLVRMARGSAQQNLSKGIVENLSVIDPDERLVKSFSAYGSCLFDQILANVHESRTLAETRDMLLPKLMSGAIRVRDAERAVAELC
jgi:type I restriction enzyme S subunit